MSVAKKLNQIQADAHALYLAFHAYHWNVKGLAFYQIHAHTQKAYEAMGELFDDVAERALQSGEKAIICGKELGETAKAPFELKESYTDKDVLKLVLSAYEYLVEAFKELEASAQKAQDATTEAFAQEKYGALEKEIWMLKNTLA